MVKQRAHYIDLIRGLCVIGIVFIHTCAHSGVSYVPAPMLWVSLLLDVPAFFFITGMTMAYVQKDVIINNLFKLSMVFTLLSLLCNLLGRHFSIRALLYSLFLYDIRVPQFFKGVAWSYWFVPVYASALILTTLIMAKLKPKLGFVLVLFLMPYIFIFLKIPAGFEEKFKQMFLGLPLRSILFPTALMLLGYWFEERISKNPESIFRFQMMRLFKSPGGGNVNQKHFAIFILTLSVLGFAGCFLLSGQRVLNLQDNKFPFSLPYIFASFVSISGFIYFYDIKKTNRFLEHLGREAVFYYAGQGVSSSVLFVLVEHVDGPWGVKLLIMFAVNLVLTVTFSELLRLIYFKTAQLMAKV